MPDYKQADIAEEIENRITNGLYKDKLPSATELSDEFNVNIRTMSKSLSLLAKKHIIVKKRGIGAFVNKQKAPLILVNYRFPGHIRESSYHSLMWDGIRDAAETLGCKLELTSRYDGELDCFDGIIQLDHGLTNKYSEMDQKKIPFVVIEHVPDAQVASVSVDVYSALYDVFCNMYRSGMKKIAYIGMTTSRSLTTDVRKFHAWQEASDDMLQVVDYSLVQHVWPLPENSYAAMKKILQREVPDVVFTTCDVMAPGIYRALREENLKIPKDVSVLGCDGLNIELNPSLATIRVPRYDMGAKSLELLLEMIREPGRRTRKKLSVEAEFVPGKSLKF